MDSPHLLASEWERKGLMSKIDSTYNHIWVYGPENFHDPMTGLDVPESMRERIEFVGFLKRQTTDNKLLKKKKKGEYLLVTTGGGGDGIDLIDNVMSAYEQCAALDHKTVVVLGPYMPTKERKDFLARGKKIENMKI